MGPTCQPRNGCRSYCFEKHINAVNLLFRQLNIPIGGIPAQEAVPQFKKAFMSDRHAGPDPASRIVTA